MKIICKKESIHKNRPDGLEINYYLRDEYEIHYNEQHPNTTQVWHYHEKIFETIFIIQGELTAKWKEKNKIIEKIVQAGDLIEVENTPHSFVNHTNQIVKFLVIKQVLSGENKRELFKTDKIIDE